MAEEERLTKKERREQARAERKRKEEEARKQAQRKRLINTTATVGVLAIVAIILIPTFQRLLGGDDVEEQIELTAAAVAEAREANGCVVSAEDSPQPEPYTHYESAQAPPADALYTQIRPTHSGPHFIQAISPVSGIPRNQIDERGSTHNLEHGAVIVWFNPDEVDGDEQNAIEDWQRERADQGFLTPRSGGAVMASPYEGNFTEGKPIALRAWGQALDCDTWDETYADAFVIDYFGTHGIAPERNLTPYPEGVLGYTDKVVEDNTEAPTGDRHDDESDDHSDETESSSEATSEAEASEDASTEPSESTS